jgi:NADPH-ferrihemoprotein reductase
LVLATHYEGDPTDNAKAFHKWLKNSVKSENKLLTGLEYCVMGLGDTSYEQFNEMAKFCDKCITTLGGKLLYKLGAANAETYTTEDDFFDWKKSLWSFLF